MQLKGRCMCGDISYAIQEIPRVMGLCHCKHCQRQGGSAFSEMAIIARDAFRLVRGEPKRYESKTDSGNHAEMAFCGRCGSPLFTVLANDPEHLLLKVGTLQDTSWFRPQYHVWTEDKQKWLALERAVSGDASDSGSSAVDTPARGGR